jgi:hypothetical protein
MVSISQVLSVGFLLAVLAILFKVLKVCIVFFGRVFYYLCLYPLYIAFYIGLFPLIWLFKKVF